MTIFQRVISAIAHTSDSGYPMVLIFIFLGTSSCTAHFSHDVMVMKISLYGHSSPSAVSRRAFKCQCGQKKIAQGHVLVAWHYENLPMQYIEDLTRVVISYEIYMK